MTNDPDGSARYWMILRRGMSWQEIEGESLREERRNLRLFIHSPV
jgi:hypothetical protein